MGTTSTTDDPAGRTLTSGRHALDVHAPDAARAVDTMLDATWAAARRSGNDELMGLTATVVAGAHGLTPLRPSPGASAAEATGEAATDWRAADGLTDADRAVVAFAEQFAVDVATIDDAQRRALATAGGEATGDLVQAMYVLDMVPRLRSALDALFGASDWGGAPVRPDALTATDDVAPWTAIDGFIRVVPRLDALDPVLTELVRLRGARQHQCRLCQSLRSRPALLAGADDTAFAAIDDHERSDLSADQKAALALTDAMIWSPARLPADTVAAVRATLTDAQTVELVLDVARNATNKIAVAFAADAPHVDEGYEIYEIDADGEAVYGLTLDE